MHIGYARVSTIDQNPALQMDALKTAGCDKVFTEKASGSHRDRPQLKAALNYLREGDTLVVWKLSRLARSLTTWPLVGFRLPDTTSASIWACRRLSYTMHNLSPSERRKSNPRMSSSSSPVRPAVTTMSDSVKTNVFASPFRVFLVILQVPEARCGSRKDRTHKCAETLPAAHRPCRRNPQQPASPAKHRYPRPQRRDAPW